jgi:hypothetical protein
MDLYRRIFSNERFVLLSQTRIFRMINYQKIAELLNWISEDAWDILHEIKQRRPAMMLSKLIDCRRRAWQQQERVELLSPKPNPAEPETITL